MYMHGYIAFIPFTFLCLRVTDVSAKKLEHTYMLSFLLWKDKLPSTLLYLYIIVEKLLI